MENPDDELQKEEENQKSKENLAPISMYILCDSENFDLLKSQTDFFVVKD